MIGVVDHVGVVFLFLHLHFVERGIFGRAEDDRVFVEPFGLLRRMREIGEMPRFAAVRVDQPELHARRVGLRFGAGARAEECDLLAVGRPLRLQVVVGAARQRDLVRVAGQARQIEIGDAAVFILVAGGFRPRQPLAVGRNFVLADGFAIDEVFRLPRLFFCGGLGVVRDGDR